MLKNKNGFSLMELLIVIGIVALLAGLAIPMLSSTKEDSKTIACNYNQQFIEQSYKMHLLIGDRYTLKEILELEFNGPNDKCPADGTYSVLTASVNEVHINCSFHGSPRFNFNFDVSSVATIQNNLSQLISGMQGFADSIKSSGYLLVSGTNGGVITPTPGNNNKLKNPANGRDTDILMVAEALNYFGESSNVLVDNKVVPNYRVALDKDQKVLSVSYKKGAYGYIIFADGSMYKLDNYFYLGSAELGNKTPLSVVEMDKSALSSMPSDKYSILQ